MAPWEAAVQLAAGKQPPGLLAAVQDDLICLWSDLDEAMRRALHGGWSMECDWLTERIVTFTQLAGVTPWEEVPTSLVLDGTYQGIMMSAGFGAPEIDLEYVRDLAERSSRYNSLLVSQYGIDKFLSVAVSLRYRRMMTWGQAFDLLPSGPSP